MISHSLFIAGEDVSGYLVSAKLSKSEDYGKCDLTIANIYGIFTNRWRDDGDENAKVSLILRNERHNCIGATDIRNENGGINDITIESNDKQYYAFCGYAQKIDYDEQYVKITATTEENFLAQEPMPDGVKPTGGTAFIATPPAKIILETIKQHKDPVINVSTLTEAEAASKGYPVLQVQRKDLPGYVPPVPPGGSQAVYPSEYEFLSIPDYNKLYPHDDGAKDGWKPGTGIYGKGYYRKRGSSSPGSTETDHRTCGMTCRYKALSKCCKATECAYKKKGTLCRQVKCPYDTQKRSQCFLLCPYDTGDCKDSVTSAEPFECPTCGGSGSSSVGGTCSTCGGSGYSTNQAVNSATTNAKARLQKITQALKEAKAGLESQDVDTRRESRAKVASLQREQKAAQAELNKLGNFEETPLDDESAAPSSKNNLTGPGDELVYVDFWNPQIVKDQVQGVKGIKYLDVINAVERATGGIFYIDNKCEAKFVPPNYVENSDVPIDITHLVTKQGLGKNAMGHANIVVVYGSGITEPGSSPVERERHKVIGYLAENTDSVQRHGTIQAAEVDVHYLPKQSQVEELAGNLIEYYKGDDDVAEVEAIGICPNIFQKVTWKVPIGPQMDTENCQFGSTAIMAVVSGRVNKVDIDYSTKGWITNLEVSTVEDEMSTAQEPSKTFVLSGDYAFANKETYDKLKGQQESNWGIMNSMDGAAGATAPTPYFDPASGDNLYVRPSADGKSLELAYQTGDSFGKVGDKPAESYALMKVSDSSLLQKGNAVEMMAGATR